MTKKISHSDGYYIDTFAQGASHEMFNASLMLMCSMAFNRLKCNISKSSFLSFTNIVKTPIPSNIKFNNVFVVKGAGRASLLLRYLVSALQNIMYLVVSPKKSIIIFSFNNLFSLRIINFLNKICKRKIVIFCHGEMEGLVNDESGKGFLHSILIKLAKGFFLSSKVNISEGIYFSVLGDSLKKNLANVIPECKMSKFISIDHPYIFKEAHYKKKTTSNLFHIGTVGTFTKLKGRDSFITFIKGLTPASRKKVDVSVVGQVSGDISILEQLSIHTPAQNKILSRQNYNSSVENLDLILFFYPNDTYKITASAAVYDAILHEKPILSLKNDYFVYLFEKFGDFGYLYNNIDSMAEKLNELINRKTQLEFDFVAIREKLTPEKLSFQLADELIRIGYLYQ